MDDDAGALDVFEELDAEAGAEVCAFDEAGQVGDGEGFGRGGSRRPGRRRDWARGW